MFLCQSTQQKTKLFRRTSIMMFLLHIFGNDSNIDMIYPAGCKNRDCWKKFIW